MPHTLTHFHEHHLLHTEEEGPLLGNSPLLPSVSLLEGVGGAAGLSATGDDGGVSGTPEVGSEDTAD